MNADPDTTNIVHVFMADMALLGSSAPFARETAQVEKESSGLIKRWTAGEGITPRLRVLHAAFCDWCRMIGYTPTPTAAEFARSLRALGMTVKQMSILTNFREAETLDMSPPIVFLPSLTACRKMFGVDELLQPIDKAA